MLKNHALALYFSLNSSWLATVHTIKVCDTLWYDCGSFWYESLYTLLEAPGLTAVSSLYDCSSLWFYNLSIHGLQSEVVPSMTVCKICFIISNHIVCDES